MTARRTTSDTRPTSFATARIVPAHLPERAGPGESAMRFDRGDFLLTAGRTWKSRLIEFGQRMRIHGHDRMYVKWTHAALIVDADGALIEAVGTGVQRSHLDHYRDVEYLVVRIVASDEDRDQVVRFAEWALQRHAKYSRLSTVSIALSMLTGTKLTFFIDGQFVCSGLVATALERTGSIFDRDPAHIAPADLAKYFRAGQAHTVAPAVEAPVSTDRTSWARDLIPSLR